jgi:hypothetical protein
MKIDFEPEGHVYRIDGVVVPSVTQILRDQGLSPAPESYRGGDYCRDRGTLVHTATALSDEGDLDYVGLDPVLRPFVDGWCLFLADTKCEVRSIEQRVAHALLGVAGTLDRIIVMPPEYRTLLDIKTGSVGPETAIQTAAYAKLLEFTTGERITHRLAVLLKPDGTYSVKEYGFQTLRDDWNIFQGALNCWKWRKENGRI